MLDQMPTPDLADSLRDGMTADQVLLQLRPVIDLQRLVKPENLLYSRALSRLEQDLRFCRAIWHYAGDVKPRRRPPRPLALDRFDPLKPSRDPFRKVEALLDDP